MQSVSSLCKRPFRCSISARGPHRSRCVIIRTAKSNNEEPAAKPPITSLVLHIGQTLNLGQSLAGTLTTPAAVAAAPNWPLFLASLFASGAVSGPLLDGIHSRTGLQIYEMYELTLGGLHTSLAVPPLLGAFYVVLGSLYILSDKLLPGPDTLKAQEQSQDVRFVAAAYGVLAADLELSAWLYSHGTPFWQISVALAAVSVVTWKLLDGTKQGIGLAAFCALGAPLSELVLLRLVPLWSYPQADLSFGEWGTFVSWVPWCYFFYTPALGSLARYLWQASTQKPKPGRD